MESMDKNGDSLLTLQEYTGLDTPKEQVGSLLVFYLRNMGMGSLTLGIVCSGARKMKNSLTTENKSLEIW